MDVIYWKVKLMELFVPEPTVLVVDDEASTREILCDILKDEGFVVQTASNGRDALRQLSNPVGLVILDLCMPGFSGVETCEEMKRHAHTSDIPVLILSGCNRESMLPLAIKAGALDFVEKPVRCSDLRAKVSAAMMLPRLEDPSLKRRLFQELVQSETIRFEQEDAGQECCFEAMCAL